MTKTIWTGTCGTIIGIAVAAVAAQQPAPPPAPQSSSESSGPRITVTGCLKEAPSSSTGTAGAAGTAGVAGTTGTAGAAGASTDTASADAKFLLTDATSSSAAAAGAADTTGATSPASAAGPPTAPQTYRLVANPAALSPHVGKKLELTGTLGEQSALKVESGKVVAASCSE